MSALALANDVRRRRAQLKRDLAGGRVQFVEVLVDPPEWLLSAKVYEVMLAVPRVGPWKAHRVLVELGVSPSKTFGGLTDRQRREFAAGLRTWHPFDKADQQDYWPGGLA